MTKLPFFLSLLAVLTGCGDDAPDHTPEPDAGPTEADAGPPEADAGSDAGPTCPPPDGEPSFFDLRFDDPAVETANACAFDRGLAPIEGARIVCMGEYLHTLTESYGLRRAILRSALEHGPVIFVEEIPEANADEMDTFMRTGDESVLATIRAELIGTQGGMEEADALARWLRAEYLALPPGALLQIAGIDVAVSIPRTLESLLAFLEAHSEDPWRDRFDGGDFAAK